MGRLALNGVDRQTPQVIYLAAGTVGNSGTGETTLFSKALPAGLLAQNGDMLRITAVLDGAANANAKAMALKFGATTIASRVSSADNDGFYRVVGEVVRISATAQFTDFQFQLNSAAPTQTQTTPAETLANAITVALTGTSAVGSNDILGKYLMIEFIPATA